MENPCCCCRLTRGALQNVASPAIGLGAVKFADLTMTRTNDYKVTTTTAATAPCHSLGCRTDRPRWSVLGVPPQFSYKKMLAFQGMSAPFMIYQVSHGLQLQSYG